MRSKSNLITIRTFPYTYHLYICYDDTSITNESSGMDHILHQCVGRSLTKKSWRYNRVETSTSTPKQRSIIFVHSKLNQISS